MEAMTRKMKMILLEMQMMNKIKKVKEWKSLKDIPFISSRRIGMSGIVAGKMVVRWTVDPQQDLDYMNALSKEEDESR